jgi:hypothetical protein
LNPQENVWDEIREKIFKNYALKSMDEVNAKLDEAAFYIERNPTLVKSITSFPYIAKSLSEMDAVPAYAALLGDSSTAGGQGRVGGKPVSSRARSQTMRDGLSV